MDKIPQTVKTTSKKVVKTKRVADGGETTIRIPAIVIPIQVQLTLGVVLVLIDHAVVVTRVTPHKICKISSLPPPLKYFQSCILFGIYNIP